MCSKPMPLVAVVFALISVGLGQTLTPEQIVRQTYAKAVFAHEVYLLEMRKSVAADPIVFNLSDFQTGTVAANQQRLSTIYASGSRDAVDATLTFYTQTANGSAPADERSLSLDWLSSLHRQFKVQTPVEVVRPEIADLRISDLLQISPWANSYVSYNVTVSYRGQTASARAYFLFGNDQVFANDPLMQNNGLSDLLTASLYPNALLQLRNNEPAIKQWIQAVQIKGCEEGKVCCTPAGRCGLPEHRP